MLWVTLDFKPVGTITPPRRLRHDGGIRDSGAAASRATPFRVYSASRDISTIRPMENRLRERHVFVAHALLIADEGAADANACATSARVEG
jgi:hypothetical protein